MFEALFSMALIEQSSEKSIFYTPPIYICILHSIIFCRKSHGSLQNQKEYFMVTDSGLKYLPYDSPISNHVW
jgi:hypothetical protein